MDTVSRRGALKIAAAGITVAGAGGALLAQTEGKKVSPGDKEVIDFAVVDRQIGKVDLEAYQPGGKHHLTRAKVSDSPAAAISDICPLYKGIRAILVALSTFPLIPEKWRKVIAAFVATMDVICP